MSLNRGCPPREIVAGSLFYAQGGFDKRRSTPHSFSSEETELTVSAANSMTNSKRMSQEERSQLSTERLIDACIEQASEQGAASITFDTVGARAGYSRNLAFQKFGSKSALIEAVIQHLHEVGEDARASAGLEDLSGLEAVCTFCSTKFVVHKNYNVMRAYIILLGAAISELSEMLTLFEEEHKRIKTTLVDLFKRGIEDGSIRSDIDPSEAALMTGAQLLGMAAHAIVKPTFDPSRNQGKFRDMLIRLYGSAQTQALATAE